MDSLVSSTKNLKKKEYKSFSNSSKKVEENLFYKASITLIPKSNKDTHKERKLQVDTPRI